VRWGVAGGIAAAWVVTLPAAGLFGALAYAIASAFGNGVLGPVLMTVLALGALAVTLVTRRRMVAGATSA
jgi:PiT family inorganic phosphate transporter